jgi:hypothetical protein
VRPDEEEFGPGPVEELRPLNEIGPVDKDGEEMGPMLEEYGPAAELIETSPDQRAVAARSR